jgi:hypothetical protein
LLPFLSEREKKEKAAGGVHTMADNKTVPHNVQVGLNVSGVRFRTSLNTVMEGARLGCEYLQILCVKILPDPLRVVG